MLDEPWRQLEWAKAVEWDGASQSDVGLNADDPQHERLDVIRLQHVDLAQHFGFWRYRARLGQAILISCSQVCQPLQGSQRGPDE